MNISDEFDIENCKFIIYIDINSFLKMLVDLIKLVPPKFQVSAKKLVCRQLEKIGIIILNIYIYIYIHKIFKIFNMH